MNGINFKKVVFFLIMILAQCCLYGGEVQQKSDKSVNEFSPNLNGKYFQWIDKKGTLFLSAEPPRWEQIKEVSVYPQNENFKPVGKLEKNLNSEISIDPIFFDRYQNIRQENQYSQDDFGSTKCRYCPRQLEVPESVRRGYGPTCAKQRGLPFDFKQYGKEVRDRNR